MPATAVDDTPEDLGVQNERTVLAWRRTNLSLLGVAALAAQAAPHAALALLLVAAGLSVSAALGWRADQRAWERAEVFAAVQRGQPARSVATVSGVMATTGVCLALAGISLILIVT